MRCDELFSVIKAEITGPVTFVASREYNPPTRICYEVPLKQEIEALGLGIATVSVKQQPKIQEFHQQEEAWSEVLSVPVAAYHTYLKAIGLTNALLGEALQLERELKE